MRKIGLLFTLLVFLFLVQTAYAFTCTIRSNSCNAGETCLFSLAKTSNSHAGNCDQYTNKVCCSNITSVTIKTDSCNSDEGGVVSLITTSNAHAEKYKYSNYNNHICAKFASDKPECSVKASCNSTETCVASMNANSNSHVGNCDAYSNKICCGQLSDLHVTQSSINENKSSIAYNDPILFNITVWNIGDTAAPNVNVSCYRNGTYLGSQIINSIPPDVSMQTPKYASCEWTALSGNWNISVRVDPANSFHEYNKSNNEAWKIISVGKITPTINLYLNGTDADKTYAYGELANFTVSLSISGKTVKLATNLTGWTTQSGATPLINLTTLNYNTGAYNITGYFEGDDDYAAASKTHYIDLGVKITFNITSSSSPTQYLPNVKFYAMQQGRSYTDFSYQEKYALTTSSEPLLTYTFTPRGAAEGRDIRFEVPTDMGMMTVELYNVSTTTGGVIPIRIIDGAKYQGSNPITGYLSYIFFMNDSLINYSSYNIKVPFNRSKFTQPNKFLRCLEFNWTNNTCNSWNVTDTTAITDPGSNYTFATKEISLKCSPALADTSMHGSSYYQMYGGMTSTFSMPYFDDFEFGYGGWYSEGSASAYPYPSESYSGSATTGYSLKVDYIGSTSATTTYCENWRVQDLCTPYNTTGMYGCISNNHTSLGEDDAARAEANDSFASSCNKCCYGSGTFIPYTSSPMREPTGTSVPYKYHAFGDCVCGSGTSSGYAVKSVNYDTKTNKFITFSYKLPSSSAMDLKIYVSNWGSGTWLKYNGTSMQGDFGIPGFQADGMWHTATISLDRDLDNVTQCTSPCTHTITQIKFGSDAGPSGQRFFIDDFMVTSEMGAASKIFYESDFEKPCQIYEWYNGQTGTIGYYSIYSLRVPASTVVDKCFGYFSQDYKYIDFVYKTDSSSNFKLRIYSDKLQNGYYTLYNMTEIDILASPTTWTKKHIDLTTYGLSDTRIKRIEFFSSSGGVNIDNFLISKEVDGECTNCNITYAGIQFNTKYFSDFEYGKGGWVPFGGSTLSLDTTNTTSYSGMKSLMMSNSTNLAADFTPGFTSPSISTSSYPYMSFAYKSNGGIMKYRITNSSGSSWHSISNFVADNTWRTVTIDLRNHGTITGLVLGNTSVTSGTIFYIDDFSITNQRPENCPYQDARHDITFNMQTASGWRIDAGSGNAKPDVLIVSVSFNNTTAMKANDFILTNITVGNDGNASTGGGTNAIQVDLYYDNVLVCTNYTHELSASPPRNITWTLCNFTATGGDHTLNISAWLTEQPAKEEWNYTNNNETISISVGRVSMPIFLAINGSQTNQTYDYPATTNATGWKSISEGNLTLYRNGSIVGSQQIQKPNETLQLAAGIYNYTLYFTQSQNYSANSTTLFLTINKASQAITLQLNGTSADRTYLLNVDQTAEIKAWSSLSILPVTIYANYTGALQSIASASSGVATNYTSISGVGVGKYLIKANSTGNENYTTATSDSYIMTVRSPIMAVSCEAGGPYTPSSTIIVVGNSSDIEGTALLSSGYIEILKADVLQDNKTFTSSSEGKFSSSFGPFAAGNYFVNVSANSTACNDSFSVISPTTSCGNQVITLAGTAYDSTTGEIISSGTVKVTIQETGDEREEPFTDGEWSVTFTSCFDSGKRYNAAVEITDASGKASYSQIQFVAP